MSSPEWKPNQQKFGPQYKVIGKDYTTPDLYAKVTGKAKYAEDFRAEGMLFAKLLLSPVAHGRVKRLDLSKALAMPGVRAILTQNDLPAPADSVTDLGAVIKANQQGEKALTMEPLYQGEPVLAVAAVDELTAAEAIEKIEIEFEHLPFVIDPLDSLRPGGPNPRVEGNVWVRPPAPPAKPGERPPAPPPPHVGELKWTAADFSEAKQGRLPMGKPQDEWVYGDLDAGFKNAALVLDETFVTPDSSHQTLEPRTALAYWQNGKVFIHMGTQSTVQTLAALGRWLNMDPNQIVLVSEYTGGGFGSKATGYIFAIIPALLAKKANAPVMMRISREEEHFIGRARPGFQGRMKVGFSPDGRIAAVDMFVICNNGPYDAVGDASASGSDCLAVVSTPGDALARRDRDDEHTTARAAKLAGRNAGNRHHGADSGPKRPASSRSTKWTFERSTAPRAKHSGDPPGTAPELIRPVRSSSKRSIAVRSSSSGKNGSHAPSEAARKSAEWACRRAAFSPVLPDTTGCSSSSRMGGSRSNRELATWEPSRSATFTAWSPRYWVCRGKNATSPGETPPRTCPGPAFPEAAKPPTP